MLGSGSSVSARVCRLPLSVACQAHSVQWLLPGSVCSIPAGVTVSSVSLATLPAYCFRVAVFLCVRVWSRPCEG